MSRLFKLVQFSDFNARLISVSFMYPWSPVDILIKQSGEIVHGGTLVLLHCNTVLNGPVKDLQVLIHIPAKTVIGWGCPTVKM